MSPLQTKHKVAIWVAVISAIGLVMAALVPGVIPRIRDGRSEKYINGTVSDAVTKASMSGVVVQLQTNEGKLLSQDTTDRDGKFNLAVSDDVVAIRLSVTISGYVPYDEKLPAQETKNDIQLVRLPMIIGISDGTPVGEALRIVAARLNVTAVLSAACSKRAKAAPVNGGQIQGDSRVPEPFLKDLIGRVKDSSLRYDIITIEEKRYEVRCF
jgi:hypothetical protein